jgi:hypothetical protein
MWVATPNYALPDDAWHVVGVHNSIRSKVLSIETLEYCHAYDSLPAKNMGCPYERKKRLEAQSFPNKSKHPRRLPTDPPNTRYPLSAYPLSTTHTGPCTISTLLKMAWALLASRQAEGRRKTNPQNSGSKLANPSIKSGSGWSLNAHSTGTTISDDSGHLLRKYSCDSS